MRKSSWKILILCLAIVTTTLSMEVSAVDIGNTDLNYNEASDVTPDVGEDIEELPDMEEKVEGEEQEKNEEDVDGENREENDIGSSETEIPETNNEESGLIPEIEGENIPTSDDNEIQQNLENDIKDEEEVEWEEQNETETEMISEELDPIEKPELKYRVHVSKIGWMDWKSIGEMVGTTGQAKAIEAIVVEQTGEAWDTNALQYRVHVQDIGWMDWKSIGEMAGTTGQSKQIEAIEFRLSEEAKLNYNLYYQTHIAEYGWLGWSKDGTIAGSEGISKGIESIKVMLLEKDSVSAPDVNGKSYIKTSGRSSIRYSGHVSEIGDVVEQSGGKTVGTTGRKLALEAVAIRLAIPDKTYVGGNVEYRVHVSNIGWQAWTQNGKTAGTKGRSLSMEAIEMKLTGEIAKYYDLYYRAHVMNYGWLGWAKNGQTAGTTKMAHRMEALQIQLVPKGCKAPGSSANHYVEKAGWIYEGGYKYYYRSGVKQLDLDGILPRQSSYHIQVNRKMNTVTVYAKDGNNGYIIPVKRFACSVGLPSTPTPTGTFYTMNKYRWRTLMGPSYGQYCTRIVGSILFHSVAGRNMTSYNLNYRDYNKLGQAASHGCVRLTVRDAKWIYDNCSLKTKVTIYDSSIPGPLGKPSTIKIPAGQTWDPTDPNI